MEMMSNKVLADPLTTCEGRCHCIIQISEWSFNLLNAGSAFR